MADDNIGALSFANTPAPSAPNLTQASQTGMQLGIELAHRKAQVEIQNQDLTFKRQALEQQKMEHMTGLLDKALTEQDPEIRKARLNDIQKVGATIGYPVPKETIDAIHKSEQLQKNLMASLPYRNLMDPADKAAFTRDAMSALMGGPIKIAEFTNKLTDDQAKLEQAMAVSGNHIKSIREQGLQKRVGDLIPYVTSPEEAQILQAGISDPRFLDTFGKVSAIKAQRTEADEKSKIASQEATAEKNRVEAKAIPQKLAIDRLRVKLQVSKDAQDIVKTVMSDTKKDRESMKELNSVGTLLSPGATMNQVNMAAQGLERAMTGSARVANAQYQGVKLSDAFASLQQKLASYRIGKPEDAKVPEGIINNYRDIMSAIKKSTETNIKASTAKYVQPAVKNGLIDKQGAKEIIQNMTDPDSAAKFMDQIGLHEEQAPAASGMKKPSAAFLNALKAKISDPAARLNFLKGQGFDTTGVE